MIVWSVVVLVYIHWAKIIYLIIPPQLFNMAEPVLEITLDDDVDFDINYVSNSNPSSKSDPIVKQLC